jgi:diadenylate cyclase
MQGIDLSYFLQQFNRYSLVDIALVTLVIYTVLMLVRGTRAVPVLRGLILLALLLGVIDSFVAQLTAFRWLVRSALPALFIAIPVIFQPELRRALAKVGQAGDYLRNWRRPGAHEVVSPIAEACRRLATRRHGALIIIERDTGLQEYIDTGIPLDAELSAALLLAIFHKDAELHDGGVIVRGQRIMAASCVMPLSNTRMADRQMGLRHRAALGTSENTDALVIVVSEETGQIAIAHNGRIAARQQQEQLESTLASFLAGNREAR